jgi:hypothetical protein
VCQKKAKKYILDYSLRGKKQSYQKKDSSLPGQLTNIEWQLNAMWIATKMAFSKTK